MVASKLGRTVSRRPPVTSAVGPCVAAAGRSDNEAPCCGGPARLYQQSSAEGLMPDLARGSAVCGCSSRSSVDGRSRRLSVVRASSLAAVDRRPSTGKSSEVVGRWSASGRRRSVVMPSSVVFWLLLLVTLQLSCSTSALLVPPPPIFTDFSGDHLRRYPEWSDISNSRYFYTLYNDPEDTNHILVGALDHVYRLDASDIRHNPQVSVNLTYSNVSLYQSNLATCYLYGALQNYEVTCRNHIRTIYRVSGTSNYYICSTGSYNPQEVLLNSTLDVIEVQGPSSGRTKCPYDPFTGYAYSYVYNGNPNNFSALYTALQMEALSSTIGIFRPAFGNNGVTMPLLRTENDPQFINSDSYAIASFDIGSFVYFFFRELALESTTYCGTAYYSRVARVCKADEGSSPLTYRFTSFAKARLICSVKSAMSNIPYNFNELYDVKYNNASQVFYGLFKANSDNQWGSAVCAYRVADIDNIFNTSSFLESLSGTWNPVPPAAVPNPRPTMCLVPSKSLSAIATGFMKTHPLMADVVNPIDSQPVYFSKDETFDKFECDTVLGYTVLYLYNQNTLLVHQIVLWNDGKVKKHRTVSIWNPFVNLIVTEPQPAWTMMFHSSAQKKWLLMATNIAVIQLDPVQCANYNMCTDCVMDPHCGWNSGTSSCEEYRSGLLQNVETSDGLNVCQTSCKNSYKHASVIPGMSKHLNCSSYCTPNGAPEWWFIRNGSSTQLSVDDGANYVMSKDGGLVILMVNGSQHVGTFQCRSNGIVLTEHVIMQSVCSFVDANSCHNATEVWIREYMNYCRKFDEYVADYSQWQCLKKSCDLSKCSSASCN